MVPSPKKLAIFLNGDGKSPFSDWFDSLRDLKAKAVIQKRLTRVGLGNFGDYKPVGEGVCELRIDFGPGYRVYFGNDGDTVVILLCGGDKSTQANDIRRAQALWAEYQEQE